MPQSLLFDIKLSLPEIPEGGLVREKLLERFEETSRKDFVILSAPAGFGKTVAAAAWARHTAKKVLWFSLGEEEADLAAFYSLLLYGLETHEPHLSERLARIASAAREAGPTASSAKHPAAALAKALKEEGSGEAFHLLFDDFHLCEDEAIIQFLTSLSDYAAPRVKIIISTRNLPRLPAARLRAQGRLAEIGVRELCFSAQETAEYVEARIGISPATETLSLIGEKTEGWPAGLQLLCLSLEGRRDVPAFVRDFSSSHKFVLDYLMEEVLKRLDGETVDFLFKSSAAEPFTAELCSLLRPGTDALETIARIESENLFLVRLDDNGLWFRYHHLFGDLLRMRAKRAITADLPALRKKAADWYDGAGLPELSFSQLLEGGFTDEAFRYVETRSRYLYTSGRIPELLRLYERLPFDRFRDHPETCIWYAWFLTTVGKPAKVPTLLAWAEEGLDKQASGTIKSRMAGGIASIRGMGANRQGDFVLAASETEKAKKLYPEDDFHDLAVASYIRGGALANLGRAEEASEEYKTCFRLAAADGDAYTQGQALCERARLGLAAGDAEGSLSLLREAEELARDGDGFSLWCGAVYIYMAQAFDMLGLTEKALEKTEVGIELTLERGNPNPLVPGYALLIKLQLDAGLPADAGKTLAALEELAQDFGLNVPALQVIKAARLSYESCVGALSRDAEPAMATVSARIEAAYSEAVCSTAACSTAAYSEAALTRREHEVLGLLSEGKPNQEIADILFLSVGTVKAHLHNISEKLGTANRTETVALARELGYLSR